MPALDKYVFLTFVVSNMFKSRNKEKEDDPKRNDNGRNSIFDLVAAIKGRLIKGKHLVDNLVAIRTLMTLWLSRYQLT